MNEFLEHQETTNIVKNPWRRFFARTFDLALYGIFITGVELLIFRMDTTGNLFAGYIELFLACLIMLVMEPLMLSTIGTTPGKWIFGLVLRNPDGEKVTFSKGFRRTFGVFSEGLGYSIPIYNLVREYKSYQICDQGEELSWDDGFLYHIKDTSGLRILGFFAGWGIIIVITSMLLFQASLPTNRGNITAAEYIENCNDFMKYNELDFGKKLMLDGTWSDNSDDFVICIDAFMLPNHQVINNDSEIQMVILEIEEDSDEFIFNINNHLAMAYNAFVGAEKSLNYKSLYPAYVIHYLNNSFEEFEFEIAGIKVSNQVEIEGYQISNNTLIPKEDEEKYFHLTFVMERTK